jgi:predicted ATPase/DNA-binding SARP family transcriptional activator
VGRDGRVEAAARALEGARLLTLTGTGGSGKTRLAVELASRQAGAAWVELAPITDPRFLGEYVATTLGVPDRKGKPSVGEIVEHFATRPLLLVLDNCEHVVEPAARLIAELLRECPALRVLATSREALGVVGERTFLVRPLSLPEGEGLDAAQASDAVALFVERAQDVRADFALTEKNAPAVARICTRLDGIPLAIELAAARVRALDPEQLAERLDSSLGLLETGSRAALPRHRTLRDTIDWSYRLLADDERTLLQRLSVFHGTFSLDAAEGVCTAPGTSSAAVLDLVTGLLDKSLLLCDACDTGTRYRLLETVREYAAEKLRETGETETIRERHARFFVMLAEGAAPAIFGGGGDEGWMARLDDEAPNFRDVHDWCEQQTPRLELSLRLAVALHWHWYARGRFNEGRLRLGIALTFAEQITPLLRGRASTVLGRLAIWQGDYAGVHGPMEEAVSLLRPLGDSVSLADALHGLGIAAALQGRMADARRLIDEAGAMAAPPAPTALLPWIEYWRGLVAEWDDDREAARQAYERALRIARQLGHKPAIAHALCVMGRLAAATRDEAAATSALGESLAIFRDIENRWGTAHVLVGIARLAASTGQPSRAAALVGAADSVREEISIELLPPDKEYRDATIAAALTQIGEPAFWCAWAEGRTQSLAELTSEGGDSPRVSSEDAAGSPRSQSGLRVRALGPLEVHTREGRIARSQWGSSRARELLLFLLCNPSGCTKGQIGIALWPDASPAQLRNTFHVTLHRLRHALGTTEAIQVEGERYRVNPQLAPEFDAELFEREARAAIRDLRAGRDALAALSSAVARYGGDFLAGERVGEWADERRDRLQHLHVDALAALGRAHMERERYADAADAFGLLLATDPVNEEACQRLMICLTHLGDRASALRAYDALARALRDDLGVKPARETIALRDKLAAAGA